MLVYISFLIQLVIFFLIYAMMSDFVIASWTFRIVYYETLNPI